MNRALQVYSCALVLQLVLAAIIPIITATLLDSSAGCLLNLTGSTCLFVEITCGFSMLFSLLLAGGWWAARRRPAAPLHADCGALAGFAALWWFTTAMTATLRGAQANDEGLPQGGARGAVIALSWLQLAAFVAAWAAVQWSRLAHARARSLAAKEAAAAAAEAVAEADAALAKASSGRLGQPAYGLAPTAAMVTLTVS